MNIYFSGIGGVGIGPLANIALDMGYSIQGSDKVESLVTNELNKRNVTISLDQSSNFLRAQHQARPIDCFVYTAALPADHPELLAAQELGVPIMKRDEFLAHVISEKNLKLIALAGTHGKTTTTGMMLWALKQLGVPISYSIGTTISFGPSGKYDPESKYFVYECDEFDRNFLHFTPHLSLITSIDYDHPDTYPTEADYTSSFRQFIYQSEQSVIWQKDANYISSRYSNSWCLQEDEVISLELAGEHNRRNGTLVLKALERLMIGENIDNRRALESFPGTDRRFEKLADNLYSDYGHHPVEISATLQMAREISDHVVLVYQPHQNVRQHEIKDQYSDAAFADAETVYWTDTYLSREDPNLSILTPQELTKNLTNVTLTRLDDNLWSEIQRHRDLSHLVLCMGAGTIDEWVRKSLQE